jgi:hypothetical protein
LVRQYGLVVVPVIITLESLGACRVNRC